MRVRRASGGAAPPATNAIEQLLLDRLETLLVCTRRGRAQLTASASASRADGVRVKLSTELDSASDNVGSDTRSDGQEMKEDGTVRGAVVAVWLRQAVVRALSPAVYARLVSDGRIFPADQKTNANAVLRCVPAPVPQSTINALKTAVEATGRKWTAGGATYVTEPTQSFVDGVMGLSGHSTFSNVDPLCVIHLCSHHHSLETCSKSCMSGVHRII